MPNNAIKNEGSWIFLSHSSKDIERIRLIRNEFEKWGQNPLAFHLKCLNLDTQENERFLFDLIKKEIEARNWFVYCESKSAQNSKYVQLEREYVEKIGKVQIWKLDLNKPIDEIILEIKTICTRLQVFLSYSIQDYDGIVQNLIDELKKNDFSVWTSENNSQNSQLINTDNAISAIAKKGFFLSLITEESLKTQNIWEELEVAKQNNAIIIVLIFGDTELEKHFKEHFFENFKRNTHYDYFRIPCIPRKADIHIISDLILTANERLRNGTWIRTDIRNIENKVQEILNYENKFHPEKPMFIKNTEEYDEVYQFPCCGKFVVIGDGVPSQHRYDGCKK
jgi:hypothetical protein